MLTNKIRIMSQEITVERGPRVIDNKGIQTNAGVIDIEVDIDGLVNFIKKSSDSEARIEKLNEFTISFGGRSYRDVLAEHFANSYIEGGFPEDKALKNARRNAALIDVIQSAFSYFQPMRAGLQASENSPFLYFDTAYIVRRKGIGYMNNCWNHEIDHLVDYLSPAKSELLDENRRMWKTALWVAGGTFVFCEASLTNSALQIEDNLGKILALVPYTGMSFMCAMATGILTKDVYYNYFHKHEKKTAQIEESSEAQQFIHLNIR